MFRLKKKKIHKNLKRNTSLIKEVVNILKKKFIKKLKCFIK